MMAALILTAGEGGRRATGTFLKQAFNLRLLGDKSWLFVTFGLAPLIYVLTWAVVQLAGGGHVPDIDIATTLLLFAMFLALAVGEEVGWTGYATEPLQSRWGALGAALILAAPWWLAHLPSMAAIGATVTDMAWWALGAVGVRILISWLFNKTRKSVLAAVIFHALLNTGRAATFPAVGSFHASRYQIASYLIIAVIVFIVVISSGARALRRP
ncbi:type II CAAX prenyl endopeptidase Rce1 family protein [uncultured Sphingomonas sp.]|uniref:CPBP family glutamic-type intramembrane protease n=1 Tax=uncultured Sphingomonas sp. TaxID=158754 RepID=UPI0035C9E6B4